ncbi:hypothetical protein DXC95_01055 [Parabacteroides sp. 20_3]|uniref:Uncharacterized protein n=1 Tax=Parabacteroides distasonis TaxID=823 RepID=A0A1Y4IB52_PARDI|nr:hypothetical protein [Parabacteroides distasonis]RGD29275.1 hypothetical protein DW205_11270 [Parabacteroides sp. AM17-47]RGK36230.1 hypothetical protein DXD19_03940 [Parabacteroides sp. 20_3]RKU74298.1 hypothetical protein DXA72_10245 [Parabacteroides sp. OF04-13BH]RLT67606.1 hypothetical protein D7V92_20920 [Parabacteroides sp. CH2-D42-20]
MAKAQKASYIIPVRLSRLYYGHDFEMGNKNKEEICFCTEIRCVKETSKKDQKGVFQEITIRQWIAKIFFQI